MIVNGSYPDKIRYWIQRADFTATDFVPVNLTDACSSLRDHNWQAELSYETALEASGKGTEERCAPGIGFTTEDDHLLHICPRPNGGAMCFYLEPHRLGLPSVGGPGPGSWLRDSVASAEQYRLLEFFFRRDYASLRQALKSDPEGLGSEEWRERCWAQIKDWRALRGQSSEVTLEEQNLSDHEIDALLMREARMESARQHHDGRLKQALSSRRWCLIAFAVGVVFSLLLYVGWLPDNFLGFSWSEQRGHWSFLVAIGLVGAGLQHLQLRALRLGTQRARTQRTVAMMLAGTVMFAGCAIFVAMLLAFFFSLLVQWLSSRLPQSLARMLVGLDREPGTFWVAGTVLVAVGITTAAAFVLRRHYKGTEPTWASILAAAEIGLGPFAFAAIGPLLLMFPIFFGVMTLMALDFTNTENWFHNNFALATFLMIPLAALLTAIAYFYGRWRAPQWEDKSSTLIGAVMFVVGVYVLGSTGAYFLVLLGAAALKASGMLG